jgi:dipeptidase E
METMKIILSGGGDSEHFTQLDHHFLSLMPSNPQLLLIPLAGESDTYGDCLERIVDTFSSIHFENIEMCLEINDLNWDYIKSFDAIYIDGGNTFKLMNDIRTSHFYELLHRFLQQGKIINGDSAGAIILGSHIETAHFGLNGDENEVDLISYQGLNLLGNIAIHCHYNPTNDEEEIMEFVQTYGFKVLALTPSTGISIIDGVINVCTKTAAFYFTGTEKIKIDQGSKLKL